MVRLIFALGLAACISYTIAAPPTLPQHIDSQVKGFSFEEWVNGIIADPEGDHLSPEEAIKATQELGIRKQDKLSKRDNVGCNSKNQPKASLSDAVICINQLAARGNAGCHIPYTTGATLSKYRLAEIFGVTLNKHGSILLCQTFAASAGRILDICVRPGATTVQGSNHLNGNIQIHISRP